MRTVAVVLAGGSGRRFGGSMPKQLQLLAGRTLVEHCVAAFDQAPDVDDVLVVMASEFASQTGAQLRRYRKLTGIVAGGSARSDSTREAIAAIGTGAGDCNVLFHDAARPLVDQRIIADCVTALRSWEAIGVVVPSSDTIVEVSGGILGRVLPRDSLARCQTPQGFRLSVIGRAYRLAAADPGFAAISATDDCGVVRRYLPDVPIGAVPGSERNIKVTYPADLALAETLLGQGSGPAAPPAP
jgi:ribitol-5-phosphate 2-dehydrogenase (NADP+) / D-ribitol-5-phosphate cytidylyltransferase